MSKRIELTEYNAPNSKAYLNEDGTITVEIYDKNISVSNSGIMPLSDDYTTVVSPLPGIWDNVGVSQGDLDPFNIIDTYISSSETTYEEDKIKIGVERVNGNDIIHRALLKFDLPQIPPSYSLVNATLNMIGYYDENYSEENSNTMISIHQLKKEWSETDASWSNMKDEFYSNIENYFHATRSGGTILEDQLTITSEISQIDITDLVQRWYNNEPNYGLMLSNLLYICWDIKFEM